MVVPLRLLDCLGLPVPSDLEAALCVGFVTVAEVFFGFVEVLQDLRRTVVDSRFGELRKAEGEGMVIVAIEAGATCQSCSVASVFAGRVGFQTEGGRMVAIMLDRLCAEVWRDICGDAGSPSLIGCSSTASVIVSKVD